MRKTLSLLLALLLLLGTAAQALETEPAGEPMELPEYLDAYKTRKFLADGEGVTLKVAAVYNESTGGDMTNSWIAAYIKKHTGITLEFDMIPASAVSERRSLMFVGDELPDILFALNFSTALMVRYGDLEGQLLDFSPYINEETMPALSFWFEQYPEYKALCTSQTGAIYGLPRLFNYVDTNQTNSIGFLDTAWMTANGYEMPKTLDELNTLLYAFKAQKPNSAPLGGSEGDYDPRHLILNAYGFLTTGKTNQTGVNAAMRNGEVVIPVMEDVYYDYLQTMRQYYADGIINEDFFTMAKEKVTAQFAAGDVLFMSERPSYFVGAEAEETNYAAISPLTSAQHEKAEWASNSSVVVGGIAVSADTEHAELICKLLDWFYTDEGSIYMWEGPVAGEDTLGLVSGLVWSEEEQKFLNPDQLSVEDGGTGRYADVTAKFRGFQTNCFNNLRFGSRMGPMAYTYDKRSGNLQTMLSVAGMEIIFMENGTPIYVSTLENVGPYTVNGYPSILWLSDADATRASELASAISTYVSSEVAKFIVGTRELNETEWAAFQADLKRLNVDAYKQIYVDAYATYQDALNDSMDTSEAPKGASGLTTKDYIRDPSLFTPLWAAERTVRPDMLDWAEKKTALMTPMGA